MLGYILVKNIFLQDFLMATDLATFFIRIDLSKAFQHQEDICLDNHKTKERLEIKMQESREQDYEEFEVVLLISRYPLTSTKKWIVANEKEVLDFDFSLGNDNYRTIDLSEGLKVVPI
jgi:hypothetical protein